MKKPSLRSRMATGLLTLLTLFQATGAMADCGEEYGKFIYQKRCDLHLVDDFGCREDRGQFILGGVALSGLTTLGLKALVDNVTSLPYSPEHAIFYFAAGAVTIFGGRFARDEFWKNQLNGAVSAQEVLRDAAFGNGIELLRFLESDPELLANKDMTLHYLNQGNLDRTFCSDGRLYSVNEIRNWLKAQLNSMVYDPRQEDFDRPAALLKEAEA